MLVLQSPVVVLVRVLAHDRRMVVVLVVTVIVPVRVGVVLGGVPVPVRVPFG